MGIFIQDKSGFRMVKANPIDELYVFKIHANP